MYAQIPAEAVVAAFQMVSYFFTTVAALATIVFVPRT